MKDTRCNALLFRSFKNTNPILFKTEQKMDLFSSVWPPVHVKVPTLHWCSEQTRQLLFFIQNAVLQKECGHRVKELHTTGPPLVVVPRNHSIFQIVLRNHSRNH